VRDIKKIEDEMRVHGRVLSPEEIRANQVRPYGAGSISLSDVDQFTILRLYYQNPSRTLRSYRDNLVAITGTWVHYTTISRVLLYGFPYKGRLVKPNLIPLDKFKITNQIKAYEYLKALFYCHPYKVIFGDEKHLKGEELFCQRVRVDPSTGIAPAVLVDSDFRNTHNLTGFCSINEEKPSPLWVRISKLANNKEEFRETCMQAMRQGYFQPFDVIGLDNATVHNEIREMLWHCMRVYVLYLPARCPEWNPKELIWQMLVEKLMNEPLHTLRERFGPESDIVARVAQYHLNQITFEDVRKCFSKCYDFLAHWQILDEFGNFYDELMTS